MWADYNGTAGDRPLSSRNQYLLNQMIMRTKKGDMFHCICSVHVQVVYITYVYTGVNVHIGMYADI